MDENGHENRTLVLMFLLAGWLLAYGMSIFLLARPPDPTAATLPTLSRSVGFLGWQGVAGMIAFGCWGAGRGLPKGSGIRRISAAPLVMASALVVVMLGMTVFG